MEIPVQEKVALVSDEDFERVSKFKWNLNSSNYAGAWIDGEQIFLHRFIMGARKGEEVDHINGSRLDCRRENLRLCTHSQNIANDGPRINNKLGIKGVDLRPNGKYRTTIRVNYKKIHVGSFVHLKEAALAYNEASRKYFGEFGYQNKIEEIPC